VAQRRQRAGTSGSASPPARRSARRLIADSELRRIAPLAGRISHQYRAKRRAELGAVQATRVSVFSR